MNTSKRLLFRFVSAILCFACVLTLPSRAALAETFESQAAGTVGTTAGWSALFGTSSSVIDAWHVLDSSEPSPSGYPSVPAGMTSARVFATPGGGSPNYQLAAPFTGTNTLPDTGTVYYAVSVVPMVTGNNVQDLRFGGRIGTSSDVILFGVHGNTSNTGSAQFNWQVGSTLSTQTYTAGHGYRLQLTIDQSAGATSATGSLAVCDLTAGELVFTPVAGLQRIALGLSSTTKVSQWTGWAMRTYGRQMVDDFHLSVSPGVIQSASAVVGDFDAKPAGTTGTVAGWAGLFGTGSSVIDAWQILNPSVPVPSGYPAIPAGSRSARVFATSGGGSSNYQMAAPFEGTNVFADTDTVYYAVSVAPMVTGNNVQEMRFGSRIGTASDKILFGVHGNTSNTGSTQFQWQVDSALSTQTYTAGHWYRLQLTIDQSAGATGATGSLAVCDLTAGEVAFTPVAGLQGISLGLSSTTKVTQWTGWAMRTYGKQIVDDFYLSTLPANAEIIAPQDTPYAHQWPWVGEPELYGYAPLFHPAPVEFDNDNRPYIRNGETVQTLNDEKTGWIGLNFADAIQSKYPAWDRGFGDGAFFEQRVVFDTSNNAYMHVATAYKTTTSPLNTQGQLLYSTDRCRTWKMIPIWDFQNVQIEHRDGHNDRSSTPIILACANNGGSLYVIKLTWNTAHDTLSAKLTLVATDAYSPMVHSGNGNATISVGDKVHIVYASSTAVSGNTGTPVYAVTYDRTNDSLTMPVLLGCGGTTLDNHNIPSITRDSQGYLHVVFGGHHTPDLNYAKSTSPDSTAAWSAPVTFANESLNSGWGHTYVSLLCDQNNRLHVVTRWSGIGYVMRLAHLSKQLATTGVAEQNWSTIQQLVVPCRGNYQVWHHKLSLDADGRLMLFYEHEPHNLTQSQYDAYNLKFPGDNLTAEGPPPSGGYQWYDNVRPRWQTLLRSANGGESWRLGRTADFMTGVH